MPDIQDMAPGEILAEASVAGFIGALGIGIAEAQTELDRNSVQQMAEFVKSRDEMDGRSLLDLGLSPAFYHYQHADITCSLQLGLRVAEEVGVGLSLGGSFGDATAESGSSREGESESSSGSSTGPSTREAKVRIAVSAQGALRVGGTSYRLQGPDAMARIGELAARLRADSASGVERVRTTTQRCGPVNPTEVPEQADVVTTPNTVGFTRAHGIAFIRIAEVPASAETYSLSHLFGIAVQPAASVEAHAAAVADAIRGHGFTATVHGIPTPGTQVLLHALDGHRFDHPRADRPEQRPRLDRLALFLRQTGVRVELEGFTDRSGTSAYNLDLGQRRGEYVRDHLRALGVPSGQLDLVQSRGGQRWAEQGQPDGQPNEKHRIVEIRLPKNYPYLILLEGRRGRHIYPSKIGPDQRGDVNGTGNGFVAVALPGPGALTGRIDIGEHPFELSGTAVDGDPQNSTEAYARNLADAINAKEAAGVSASATGSVVHLCPRGAWFELLLVTSESRQIQMSGAGDVTVKAQFRRSQSRDLTQERTGNRTVATGATLDVRFRRRYEIDATGNSSISARLVAVPAPPEFLTTIRAYLSS